MNPNQGPIVQSIINLTTLLMTKSLTVVAEVFSNADIFRCKTHIFSAKIIMYLPYL